VANTGGLGCELPWRASGRRRFWQVRADRHRQNHRASGQWRDQTKAAEAKPLQFRVFDARQAEPHPGSRPPQIPRDARPNHRSGRRLLPASNLAGPLAVDRLREVPIVGDAIAAARSIPDEPDLRFLLHKFLEAV
jgi:hypothetical protein